MSETLPDTTFYQKRLDLPAASFSHIDHEEAIVAVVYRVFQPGGKDLILKISERENDYTREVYFLRLLEGKILIPQIEKLVPPEENKHGAILMECLPGALLTANEMTESLARELGRTFARIHLNRLSGYGDPIRENLSEDPREYFSFKFEEGLDECRGHLPEQVIEACQSYYNAHLHLLDRVDGPCIVHRDFRPGNLMVHQGKLLGVIDWAGARASFAEEDFCSIEHVDWLGQHKQAFFSAYASIRPLPKYSHLVPFLRLNKAIATIGFTVKRGTWKTRDSRIYRSNRQFLHGLLKHHG